MKKRGARCWLLKLFYRWPKKWNRLYMYRGAENLKKYRPTGRELKQ